MFTKQLDPFARVEKALAVFNKAVAELREAAQAHHDIADEAERQREELHAAAVTNRSAGADAIRRADKIAEFLA